MLFRYLWGTSVLVAVTTVVVVVMLAAPAAAHPLGNFTVNVYAGLEIGVRQIAVDFVVDLAEVATLQATPYIDDNGDGVVTDRERAQYGEAGCAQWTGQLSLREDGRPLSLRVAGSRTASIPGEAGMSTLRIECRMVADRPWGEGDRTITFADSTFPSRRGWREVTATGAGTIIVRSDVPRISSTARLTAYPPDGVSDPIDQRSARVVVRPGRADDDRAVAPAATVAALGGGGWSATLNDMVEDRLFGQGLLVVAVLAALALGVLHAAAPGHGKTVVAAYLIGERGSVRHAGVLALSVAVTHTAGVLGLGALLWVAFLTAPEGLYPVLGVASGGIIAGLGASMLRRAWRRGPVGRGHHHGHHDAHEHAPAAPLRAGTVVALGFAGGLVPTPSALLVLLGALSVGRVWVGLLLVVAYGVGMAATLVGLGLVLAHARNWFERRFARRGMGRLHALSHALPSVTAGLVVLGGLALMARSAFAAWL